MADELTPEVIELLTRLLYDDDLLARVDNETLYAATTLGRGGKDLVQRAVAELNRRGEKFGDIGAHYGVTESTASRWAKPKPEES